MFKEKVIKEWICLLAIMLAAKGWAVAKEATQGTETKVVGTQTTEPKLVMEWKFDEPVDIIFGEATMTVKEAKALGVKGLEKRSVKEIVKVQYPKVVVLGKKVKYTEDYEELHETSINFFDRSGKKKKGITLQQSLSGRDYGRAVVLMSKNRKYIGVVTPVLTEWKKSEWEKSVYGYIEYIACDTVIMDTEGNKLWGVVQDSSYVYLSPNGKYIVAIGSQEEMGPLAIYNKDGMVKEIRVLECLGIDFSNDGTWFAAAITEPSDDLIIFDEKGNELWRKNITKGLNKEMGWCELPSSLNISDDDIITIIAWDIRAGKKIKYCFNKKGNLIESKPKEEE